MKEEDTQHSPVAGLDLFGSFGEIDSPLTLFQTMDRRGLKSQARGSIRLKVKRAPTFAMSKAVKGESFCKKLDKKSLDGYMQESGLHRVPAALMLADHIKQQFEEVGRLKMKVAKLKNIAKTELANLEAEFANR